MSRRHKEPTYDQNPDAKQGLVIAGVLVAILVVGVILIIRGLVG